MAPFTVILPSNAAALRGFRRKLREWLASLPLPEHSRVVLVLAAHEAAANGIEHARGPVTIDGFLDDSGVVLEVRTTGAWGASGGPASEERGRGMILMKGLVPEMEVVTTEAGSIVRFRTPASPTTRAGSAPPRSSPDVARYVEHRGNAS